MMIQVIYSISFQNRIQAVFDLVMILVIVLILGVSLYLINQDLLQTLLIPLKKLLHKIKEINLEDFTKKNQHENCDDDFQQENQIIQQATDKLSHLLILSYGQSGSKIVSVFL